MSTTPLLYHSSTATYGMFQCWYSKRSSYQLALVDALSNAHQHSTCLVLYQVLHSAKVGRHVACCCISTPLPCSWRTARALWWHMRGDAIQDRTRHAVYSIPRYHCGLDVLLLLLLHACVCRIVLSIVIILSCSMCRGIAARTHPRTYTHARSSRPSRQ